MMGDGTNTILQDPDTHGGALVALAGAGQDVQ